MKAVNLLNKYVFIICLLSYKAQCQVIKCQRRYIPVFQEVLGPLSGQAYEQS